MRRLLQVTAAVGLLGAVLSTPAGAEARDISRDTLPANDGWAAADGGTTRGAAADDAHVLHHNEFRSVTQRAPRVRFGQVHLHNNRYLIDHGDDHRYSVGVSTESAVYAENNAFTAPGHVEVADLFKSWNGTALHQTGTLFNGFPVDLLTIHNAYNSGSERDLTADVGWTPTLHTKIDSADTADREVARGAGAGRLS